MKYRYHIWAGAAQSSLSRSKSFTRPCGWWLIFHSRPLSPQTQHCKHIATLLLFPWQKIQVNSILYLHQFRLSQRGHTPCHFHEAETSVCVRKLRREFYSDRFSQRTATFVEQTPTWVLPRTLPSWPLRVKGQLLSILFICIISTSHHLFHSYHTSHSSLLFRL